MDGVLTEHEALALGLPAAHWSDRIWNTPHFPVGEVHGEDEQPKFGGVVPLSVV